MGDRRHHHRRSGSAHPNRPRDVGFCADCRKQTWASKREAKAHWRSAHPGAHLDEYPCPHGRGWHYGHLQRAVIHGDIRRRN